MDVTVTGNDVSKRIMEGMLGLPYRATGMTEEQMQGEMSKIFNGSSMTFWTPDEFSKMMKKHVKKEDINKDTIFTAAMEEFLQVICIAISILNADALMKLVRLLRQLKFEVMLDIMRKKS